MLRTVLLLLLCSDIVLIQSVIWLLSIH